MSSLTRLLQTYNPGNLMTELARHMETRWALMLVAKMIAYPPRLGAYTEIYAGLSTELNMKDDQGGWVVPWGRKTRAMRPDIIAGAQQEKGTAFQTYEWCDKITKEWQ